MYTCTSYHVYGIRLISSYHPLKKKPSVFFSIIVRLVFWRLRSECHSGLSPHALRQCAEFAGEHERAGADGDDVG